MRTERLLIAVLVFLVLLICLVPQIFSEKVSPESKVLRRETERAPAFTLRDAEGKPLSVPQKGREVLLIFFSNDCPACEHDGEQWPIKADVFKKNDITMLGISQSKDTETQDFIRKKGISFTVFVDKNLAVSRLYEIVRLPYYVLIGSKGEIEMKGQWNNVLDYLGEEVAE